MNKKTDKEHQSPKIKIGITQGDINGVGYEIIIKSFLDQRLLELCTPIVYGSSKIASYHRKTLNIPDFSFHIIKKPEQLNQKRANIINISDKEVKIELGKPTAEGGEMAFESLESATEDLKKGLIDVLVTAPINKKNIQSDSFTFPGHTEYLAQKFRSENHLMLMISNKLRIGVVTGHIPLNKISEKISKELILDKLNIFNKSLIKDFNIRKPKIAILGLNPHAGDNGLIGEEEQTSIIPAIKTAAEKNILAFGPYPADGFFGSGDHTKFDGILAMYHDQGLIPFKTLSFDQGVNFTAGLPIIRTSPAHGTAYEIAGNNAASEKSFRQAIYIAIDIFKNRKMHYELNKNPLKTEETENKD